MFCLYCGNQLPDDAIFCNKCGKQQKPVDSQILPVSSSSVPLVGFIQPTTENVPMVQGTPQADAVPTAQDTSATFTEAPAEQGASAAPGSSIPSQAVSSALHVEPQSKDRLVDSHSTSIQQVQDADDQHPEKLESTSERVVSEQPHPNQPQRIEPEPMVSTERKATGHISRRAVVIAGLAGAVAVAGGLTWAIGSGTLKLPFLSGNSNVPVHPTSNANSNGTMFGYDLQRTNFNPSEHVLNPGNVSRLVPYWTVSIGKGQMFSSLLVSPIVANGVVFIDSYAFDAQTGATVRTYSAGGTLALADGVIYVGSDKLYALDAKTGAKLWEYTPGDPFFIDASSPLVFNGVIYVGGKEHKLYALDAKTGVVFWTYPYSVCCVPQGSVGSSPAVADGIIYVCDDSLYALSAKTGVLVWSYTASSEGSFFSTPSIVDGVVYAGGPGLHALDAKTGMKLWNYSTENGVTAGPAVGNGAVYVVSDLYILDALDARTGIRQWRASIGQPLGPGMEISVSSPPTIANGVVYVGSDDHKIYALDAKTGATLWTYLTGDRIFSAPTIANGVVYVVSDDGKLYAFHLPV